MEPTDPNTGVPLYDPCHMYSGSDYSSCFANGGSLPDTSSAVSMPWYDQAWFPVTVIGLLVVLVGIVGYIAYTRKTA